MKPSRREWCDKKATTSVTAFSGAPDDTGAAQAGSCTGTQPRTGAQGANPPTYAHTGRSRAGVGTLLEATKFGRQNPLCARWNSPEQLLNWREAWASAVNRALEEKQQSARVTHLSHTALGLDEQLTAHEGSQARKLEMQGIKADRCELNRQLRADNKLLRELKAQLAKLSKVVENAAEHSRCGCRGDSLCCPDAGVLYAVFRLFAHGAV